MTDQTDAAPDRFTAKATTDSHFSWLRTKMSLERTLMSCVRTATALIGFGFTIVQFFAHFQDLPGVAPPVFPNASRNVGLALIMAGILMLAIAVHQYRALSRYLVSSNFAVLAGTDGRPFKSTSLAVALILTAIGIFVFFAVLFRLA
jgi:putative membrane protein